jgi:hypothetical protein
MLVLQFRNGEIDNTHGWDGFVVKGNRRIRFPWSFR